MKIILTLGVIVLLLFIAEMMAKEIRAVLFPFLGVIGLVVFVWAIYQQNNGN